jgi:hypothetical protein
MLRSRSTVSLLLALVLGTAAAAEERKPRIVVLTDVAPNTVEPDDMESIIRLLAHADLFEIEGLVVTTGWSNTGGRERSRSPGRWPPRFHDLPSRRGLLDCAPLLVTAGVRGRRRRST